MQMDFELFSDAKPQPFSVVISSLVLAVVDFHCHMTTNEVVGYLGGKWEPASKCEDVDKSSTATAKIFIFVKIIKDYCFNSLTRF